MPTVPLAARDCRVAKIEPAATFPVPAWMVAAVDPAAIPEEVKPAYVMPAETAATVATVAVDTFAP